MAVEVCTYEEMVGQEANEETVEEGYVFKAYSREDFEMVAVVDVNLNFCQTVAAEVRGKCLVMTAELDSST